MRSLTRARLVVLTLSMLASLALVACAGVSGVGQAPTTATSTVSSVFATLTALPNLRTPPTGPGGGGATPPSVSAFCPSTDTLAPIVGETLTSDFTTGTHGASTTCGYKAASGDSCEFTITAWNSPQEARSDYTKLMNDATQAGGNVQTLSGLGDAAFFWTDEDVTVLKGAYDFFDKCYFLPPRQTVDEQVDVQIAHMLVGRI